MPAKPVEITAGEMHVCLNAGKRSPVWDVENGQMVASWTVTDRGTALPMRVKVYTSIFGGVSRATGEDSIRVCLVDSKRGKGLKKMTWTCRTEGWQERLRNKIRETFEIALTIPMCPRCLNVMQARQNRASGDRFWGCSAWPTCTAVRPMQQIVEAEEK